MTSFRYNRHMKIAIAGYGAEGEASYVYWNTPDNQVVIVDENTPSRALPHDSSSIVGEGAYARLNGFDFVIRTPGLPPSKITTDGKIWSATNEFFAQCPAPIIGVTGTKGKGTTASLIASILRAAGKTVHLLGNIGEPALRILPDIRPNDIVVYELSSFQLWDIERSPHIAVVLLIEPDHLNVHSGFDDYVAAKAKIAMYQSASDTIIFNQDNDIATSIASKSLAKKISYPFDIRGVSTSLRLVGKHNIENASAAIAAVQEYVHDDNIIRRGLASFEGLPHRIEFVREFKGVKYYNDSFSSAPSATIAAIRSFDEPEIVVLGGIDKGANFSDMIHALREQENIKKVFVIGEINAKLSSNLRSAGLSCVERLDVSTMSEIVAAAKEASSPGDVVLLSPACASFDMFKDFYDRGVQFREEVQKL